MAINRSELNRQFAETILSKDCKIETVEALLTQGAAVDTSIRGQYALHIAAAAGNAPLVELLLKHNADPTRTDLADGKGKTAIEVAMDEAIGKLRKADRDYESVREQYWQVIEAFKLSFPKISVDVLNKVFVPFLKLAPSAFTRLVLIRLLINQGINLNQIYMMPTWGGMEETSPLHYLAALAGSHQEIQLLIEHGADPTLTCARRDGRDNKTAIEDAADFARRTPELWNNILTIVQHPKTPIAPASLGRILLQACDIQALGARQNVLNVLFAAKACLTTRWEKDKLFPAEGTLEEKNTFAAVRFIDVLAIDLKGGSAYSRHREDAWITISMFLSFVDKAVLEKKLPTFQLEPFKPNTTFSDLGDVLTLALIANTESSNFVAHRLLSLEAVDANESGDLGGGKSSFPLMIAARRPDQALMLKLLGIGADPNQSKERQGYHTHHKTVLDLLVEQKAWGFIPQFVAASKVKIEEDDLGHALLDAVASSDPAAIAAVKPLLDAGANPNIERDELRALDRLVADKAITPEKKALIPLLLARGALPKVGETTVDLKALGGDALHDAYVERRRLKQVKEEKKAREQAERRAAIIERKRIAAEEAANAERERQERDARRAALALERAEQATAKAARTEEEETSSASGSEIYLDVPPAHPAHPEHFVYGAEAPTDTEKHASIVAAFKKILVMLNEHTFMQHNAALTPDDLITEIVNERAVHPHGRVAFAYKLACDHYQNFNEHNHDLVLAIRRESFKRKLCSKTIIGNLTFYRVKSFDEHINGLTAADIRGVVAEMRAEADDVECDTRSAMIIRSLRNK